MRLKAADKERVLITAKRERGAVDFSLEDGDEIAPPLGSEAARTSPAARGQVARITKAAALLGDGTISKVDYAVVTADAITRLQQGRPIKYGDRLSWVSFGFDALTTLGVGIDEYETSKETQFRPAR